MFNVFFMQQVNNQNVWNFELGIQENMNVPIWIIMGFQQQDRQDSQNFNTCRLPVVSAQCIIGTKKYPDSSILINYDDDDYSQGYHQIKEAFRALTKAIQNDILQPYILNDDFRSSNATANDFGYNLYVFDIRYQKKFTNSQPIKVEFKFDGVVPNDINGYALVLTNKLLSVSSDGQRPFDLI